jgi:ribosomal protein S18 acetylase RimI-like enzyme
LPSLPLPNRLATVQTGGRSGVRRAEAADHPRLVRTLAAAFADDPGWSHLLPGADREQRQRVFFASELRHLVPARREVWMSEDGAAAAIWGPPERWSVPASAVLRQAPAMARVFGRRLPLALRYLIRIERSHPRGRAHWYLEFFGAEPASQGQGLGTSLLRPILTLCDRDKLGAYLESSTERSCALYERHGFEVVEIFEMPGGGPPIRRMWREPGR